MRRLPLLSMFLFIAVAVTAAAVLVTSNRDGTRVADRALAERVVLRRADLGPGWERVAAPRVAWISEDGRSVPALPPSARAVSARSAFVSKQARARVEAVVTVAPSAERAYAQWRHVVRPGFTARIRTIYTRYLAPTVATGMSVHRLPMRSIGDRTIAYRTRVRLRSGRTWSTTYIDLVYFERGRTFVALSFSRSLRPFRDPQTLAARLARRATQG